MYRSRTCMTICTRSAPSNPLPGALIRPWDLPGCISLDPQVAPKMVKVRYGLQETNKATWREVVSNLWNETSFLGSSKPWKVMFANLRQLGRQLLKQELRQQLQLSSWRRRRLSWTDGREHASSFNKSQQRLMTRFGAAQNRDRAGPWEKNTQLREGWEWKNQRVWLQASNDREPKTCGRVQEKTWLQKAHHVAIVLFNRDVYKWRV